jgi:hypothetical protein
MYHAARDRYLVVDDIADDRVKRAYRQPRVCLILTAAAIIVGLVVPAVAEGLYTVLAIAFLSQPLIVTWRGHRH